MFSGLLAFCLVCSHTLLGNFQTLHLSPARHPGWGVGWGGRSTLPGSDGCKVEEAGARRTQEPHTLSQSPLPAPCIWSWAVSALFAASKWPSGGGGLSCMTPWPQSLQTTNGEPLDKAFSLSVLSSPPPIMREISLLALSGHCEECFYMESTWSQHGPY